MQADLILILPEISLALFAMLSLLGAVYTRKDKLAQTLTWATAALFLIIALWLGLGGDGTARAAFGGMFIDDAFARFAKVTILLSAAAVLVMGMGFLERHKMMKFEYPVLVALSVTGMMFMVSAGDLMALYMGLELQSLALYVIAAMRRDSLRSTEAGLKYFVLGALSSGLLLYGASLVYGFAGTTQFAGIIAAAGEGLAPLGLLFGLVFVMAGLAFKVSAVPFHMWTPDVYEGAPTPVTAFFATAPKVAAMALFARVLHDAFGGVSADWQQVLIAFSVLSMFLGAIAAIGQRDIKRLMAYSSIAHMGYALIGLAAGTALGIEAMLTYMAIYVTMNIGTFAFILSMEADGRPVTEIDALKMLSRTDPAKALALLVLLFSLAGVPPMLGFFAKLGVWRAGLEAELVWLVIASAVASAIGAYYYLRIVFLMYFGAEGRVTLERRAQPLLWAFMAGAAAMMLVGVLSLFGVDSAAATAAAALVN